MATKSSFKEILTRPYKGEIAEGVYKAKLNNIVFAYNKNHRTPEEKKMLRDKFADKMLEAPPDAYLHFTPEEFQILLGEGSFEPVATGNGADYFTFTWTLPNNRLFTRNLFMKDLIIFMKQSRIQLTGKNLEDIPDPVAYMFKLIDTDLDIYITYENLREQNRRVQNINYCAPIFNKDDDEQNDSENPATPEEKPF